MAAPFLESVRESDYVEYFLFPDKFDDASLSDEDLQTFRVGLLHSLRSLADEFTAGHIWQKDSFNLNIRDGSHTQLADESELVDQALCPHVHGLTHYGDNVEDEWLIVALLLALTERVPGLVCRVADDDGEFLLIEAADWLPQWAEPEACTNRVFLFQGAVHIVPPTRGVVDVRKAVRVVRDVAAATEAVAEIQEAVRARTRGYPERALAQLHRSRARVPVGVATLLAHRPQLVADAVRAFCARDPTDAKTVRAMRWFPPEETAVVMTTMPRCLYAMLRHAPFTPDRRTGWTLPPATDPEHPVVGLGIKLACGFEILVADSRRQGNERGWRRYLDGLEKRGYFQHLLPGSEAHESRTAEAREYFEARRDLIEPSRAVDVATLLDSVQVDVATLRAQEHGLPLSDDDSWLELNPSDVDAMLAARFGAEGQDTDVAARLTAFLGHASDLEGAEFPPSTNQTQATQPSTNQTQATQLSTNQTQATQPSTNQTQATQLSTNETQATQLSTNQTQATQLSTNETQATQLSTNETQAKQPKAPPRRKKAKTTTAQKEEAIVFDGEAFTCAVHNILDLVVPEDDWSSDGSMSSYEDEAETFDPSRSELKQYMDQMDAELASATQQDGDFADVEDFSPVDVDMRAVAGVLESYRAQMGGAGPAGNLLGPMGVRPPTQ